MELVTIYWNFFIGLGLFIIIIIIIIIIIAF